MYIIPCYNFNKHSILCSVNCQLVKKKNWSLSHNLDWERLPTQVLFGTLEQHEGSINSFNFQSWGVTDCYYPVVQQTTQINHSYSLNIHYYLNEKVEFYGKYKITNINSACGADSLDIYNPIVRPIKYWKTSNWDDKIIQIGIKYKNIYFEHNIYQNYDTPKTTVGLRLDIPVDWKDFFTYSAKTKSPNLFKEKNILPVYSKNESSEYQFSILKNYGLKDSTLEHNRLLNSNFEYNFYYESYLEASPEEDIPEYVCICGHSKQHIVPEKQTQSIVSEIEESPQMLTPNVWAPQGIYFFLLGVCIYPIFGKLKKWWVSRF